MLVLQKWCLSKPTCSYTLPYPLPLLNVDEFLQTLPQCEASYCSLKINLKWLVTCFMFYAANFMLLYTTVVKRSFQFVFSNVRMLIWQKPIYFILKFQFKTTICACILSPKLFNQWHAFAIWVYSRF